MRVSCIVDSIAGKMGLVNEQIPKSMDWSWRYTNWPPRSPDLNPLDYHVWGYMKAMVYEHKVNTREELLQRILSAARSINIKLNVRSVLHLLRYCTVSNLQWLLSQEQLKVS